MASLKELYRLQSTLTGEQVKSLYEGEFDTNAYTDAEKNRLASLYYTPTATKTSNYTAVNGEEVRCDTTTAGFTVTLPLSGSVRIVDIVGTNINSGFGTNSLMLVTQAGHTILGESDLELDVGGLRLVLALYGSDWKVIDALGPQFAALEWDMVLNKPAFGTAALTDSTEYATAEQGANSVQVTGNQTIAGIKTFTSPLILPDNSRINGVEHFYRTTKPTARGDGSALVAGDKWYKKDTGEEWWWNGTYWVGDIIVASNSSSHSITTTTEGYGVPSPTYPQILIEFISSYFYLNDIDATIDPENYHVLRLYRNGSTYVADLLIRPASGTQSGAINYISPQLSIYSSTTGGFQFSYRYDAGNGTPGPVNTQSVVKTLYYRNVFI
jgi:hypothetical protein